MVHYILRPSVGKVVAMQHRWLINLYCRGRKISFNLRHDTVQLVQNASHMMTRTVCAKFFYLLLVHSTLQFDKKDCKNIARIYREKVHMDTSSSRAGEDD